MSGHKKSQQSLRDWTRQNWRTKSGKKSLKTGEPYFPAAAVRALKKAGLYAKATRQKREATRKGKQFAKYSKDIQAIVKRYRS
jgi:hypothetical protein